MKLQAPNVLDITKQYFFNGKLCVSYQKQNIIICELCSSFHAKYHTLLYMETRCTLLCSMVPRSASQPCMYNRINNTRKRPCVNKSIQVKQPLWTKIVSCPQNHWAEMAFHNCPTVTAKVPSVYDYKIDTLIETSSTVLKCKNMSLP